MIMRKIFSTFFFLFVIAFIGTMSAQENRCSEIHKELDRLQSTINGTKKTSEKIKLYKRMLDYLSEAKSLGEKGCNGNEEKEIEEIQKKIANLKGGNGIFKGKEFSCRADTGHIIIELKNDNFELKSYPSWLVREEATEQKILSFYVQSNELPYVRIDTVKVLNKITKKAEIAILTQEAADLSVEITERVGFPQYGATGSIYIETNDTAWKVSSSQEWVSAAVSDYGVALYCESNPTKKRRTAIVTVKFACGKTKTVNISQAIGRTTLSVPTINADFKYIAGSQDAVVECNYDQWSASVNKSWVNVTRKYGGIKIECEENPHAESRYALVTIETNDEEHLVSHIRVYQDAAPAYLQLNEDSYSSDGMTRTIYVPVKTNIADWNVKCSYGASWCDVSRYNDKNVKVVLYRNDYNSSRTAKFEVNGKGITRTFSVYQPNRGYAGRYNDYFSSLGDWRATWFSIDLHGMTTFGSNISMLNFRWKPVEFSLLNVNIDFLMDDLTINWEPVVRGFVPVTRDGRWAAFLGMGAHVAMMENGGNYFLLEFGMEANWNEKYSSRIFFKYNGGISLGMSFDIGKWY